MAKHKHCELIKAWANGAKIERLCFFNKEWCECASPDWQDPESRFRIKPEPKQKPDVERQYRFVVPLGVKGMIAPEATFVIRDGIPNLRIIFDGETGLPKKAEVI